MIDPARRMIIDRSTPCFRNALGWSLLALLTWCAAVSAADPVDVQSFASTAEEERYRDLIAEFRCPKCLNTNLLGSDAPIAKDLRQAVYRLAIEEGRSDSEVRDYLQQRYGDFVLYSPPLRASTVLLWFGPLLLLLLGVGIWIRTVRRAQVSTGGDLNADEQARLKQLLEQR